MPHVETQKRGKQGACRSRNSRTVRKLPRWRAVFFSALLTLAFFVTLEMVLALCGIQPPVVREDPYAGFEPMIALFERHEDQDGSFTVRTARNKRRFFNSQSFRSPKMDNTYRIFCMGGSTTHGRPYNDMTSFCGWLRRFLAASQPDVTWEVINAGGISYGSYRVAALMKELVRYEPDLFIVYTGHNEFLERRSYSNIINQPPLVRWAGALLNHTRICGAIRSLIDTARARTAAAEQKARLTGEVSTLLDTSIGPSAYHRDDKWRDEVVEYYRFNLRQIARTAGDVGASLILVTPASNVKNCAPFKSAVGGALDEAAEQRVADLRALAKAALFESEYSRAVAFLREALDLDDRHAGTHYLMAQALFRSGQIARARIHYTKARDEDIVPLRALSSIIAVTREFVREEGLPMVDFVDIAARWMHAQYGRDIPGEELFLDHVHPTINGHRLLAEALHAKMIEMGVFRPQTPLDAPLIKRIGEEIDQQTDKRTHGIALRNLAKVMSWAGKIEDAGRSASRAIELLGDDPESLFIAGLAAAENQQSGEAETFYRRALRVDPDYVKALSNLAIILAQTGREDKAIDMYRRVIQLSPEHPNVHYNLAKAYARAGRNREAIREFNIVLNKAPDDADAHYDLAELYIRLGDTKNALVHLTGVVRLTPGDAGAYFQIARIREGLGETLRARKHYERVLALEPDWTAAATHLAELKDRAQTQKGD